MIPILKGVVGSTAYGLNHANSDLDYLGIHMEHPENFLGFGFPDKSLTHVYHDPVDFTSHELVKFLRLALNGNPTILEILYLESYITLSDIGEELISLRQGLLSSTAILGAYSGYAVQQAKRLVNKDKFPDIPVSGIEKHGRHCYRLLVQAEELLSTGTLTIRLSDTEIQNCFDMGKYASTNSVDFKEKMIAKANNLDTIKSALPKQANRKFYEEWLISLRKDIINGR